MLRVSDGPTLDNADGGESRRWTRSEAGWLDHRHGREIDGHHRRTGLVMDGKSDLSDGGLLVLNSLGRRATPVPRLGDVLVAASEGKRIEFGSVSDSGIVAPLASLRYDGRDHDVVERELAEKQRLGQINMS